MSRVWMLAPIASRVEDVATDARYVAELHLTLISCPEAVAAVIASAICDTTR